MGMKGFLKGKGATNSPKKQRTSANHNVRLILFVQRSKGCSIRPGVIQRVFQKVAYVRVVLHTSVYYL
jgi:hypothetical protein